MSLFGSLTAAVSGLDAQQAAIANISDNIANSSTIGYKQVDTSFSQLVTESNAFTNQPGGVQSAPVYENSLTGSLTQSSTETNLAISGQGFFQVAAPPTGATATSSGTFGTESYYTRRGDFTLNSAGYLVNGAGYYLEAKPVDPQTLVATSPTAVPIQVAQKVNQPVATSTVTLAANLPSSSATSQTFTPASTLNGTTTTDSVSTNSAYVAPAPVSITVYDKSGNTYQATIQFNHSGALNAAGTGIDPNVWTADISIAGTDQTIAGGQKSNDVDYSLALQFSDGSGTVGNTAPAGTLVSIADNTPNVLAAAQAALTASGGDPTTVSAPLGDTAVAAALGTANTATTLADGTTVPATLAINPTTGLIGNAHTNGASALAALTFDFSPANENLTTNTLGNPQSINFSFGSYGTTTGLTQFAGTSLQTNSFIQNGIPQGHFTNLTIDASGNVNLNYDNGESETYYQIPVATFNAPDQLQSLSGETYAATTDSGVATIGAAGTNGAGTISPSTVEGSTVDVASQFTELIVAQRVYSANSKVITTADQLLQDVLSLIR